MAELVKSFDGKEHLVNDHIPGPEGVRGRNSDNTLINEVLGWQPNTKLADGLRTTYFWIKDQVENLSATGFDVKTLGTSKIVKQEEAMEYADMRNAQTKDGEH